MVKQQAAAEGVATEEGEPMAPMTVDYCPNCSMPFDFCDFGDKWDTGVCREECIRRYPEIFGTEEALAQQLSKVTVTQPKKKKPEARHEVTVQTSTRSKRKVVTSVTGLHFFGVKLEAAAKLFAKHFASGAGVIKGIPGQMDKIDCQGDVEDQVIQLIMAQYPDITEDKIVRLPSKVK